MGAGPWTKYATPQAEEGGPWVKYAAGQTLNAQKNFSSQQFAEDLGVGALKGLGQASDEVSKTLNKIPYVGKYLAPSEGIKAAEQLETPTDTGQAIGAVAGNFAGNAALVEAGGELLPEAGLVRVAGQGAMGATLNPEHPYLGAAIGSGAEAVAQGVQHFAPDIAEASIRTGNKAQAYGKTPGEALISDTKGVKPETIYDSAQNSIDNYSNQLKQLYKSTDTAGSLQPALDVLNKAKTQALRENNKSALAEIADIHEQLTVDLQSGQPMTVEQDATKLLDLKRGIGKRAAWNPNAQSTEGKKLLRQVYGAIDGELDRIAPEGADINQKVSSLIEVRNAAERRMRDASTLQNVAHRVAAHTGALTGAAAGSYEGGEHYGVGGAIAGGAAGLVLPELIGSPEALALAARAAEKAPAISRATVIPLSALEQEEHYENGNQ